ncbi:hypothetical protein V2G26_006258 [Clonostachys chloroleuca]
MSTDAQLHCPDDHTRPPAKSVSASTMLISVVWRTSGLSHAIWWSFDSKAMPLIEAFNLLIMLQLYVQPLPISLPLVCAPAR